MNKDRAAGIVAVIVVFVASAALIIKATKIDTVDEAIKQAENFECEDGALTVLTPATHVNTGAKYTFPSSCLPEGWE